MKILVTNDDGYSAAGIAALEKVGSALGEVFVVAPKVNNSYVSHRVSVGSSIGIDQTGPNKWVVDGTPADCVRVALYGLNLQIDWILSGINHGGNLGADVFTSGTVAAAREGFFSGVSGIALSQFRRGPLEEFNWDISCARAGAAIQHIFQEESGVGCWNVNLPWPESADESAELQLCDVEMRSVKVAFENIENPPGVKFAGSYQSRLRTPGLDIALCMDGGVVTLSKLH